MGKRAFAIAAARHGRSANSIKVRDFAVLLAVGRAKLITVDNLIAVVFTTP